MRSFENKVAVITGAASGIGRALAQQLAQRGAELALVDVNASALAETAASVAATGRRVTTHIVDVADAARMEALAETVVAQHGRVELLVNNAGVSVTGTFEEQSLDDWRWIVGVNLWGVVHGCKFFLPHLRRAEEAHIVNLSSTFGIVGMPTQSSYCATKFAVRGLSEALWAELRGSGIGVTSVHPGAVKTNIVRDSRSADANAKQQMALRFDRMAMTPEKAAALILRAVERDKLRVMICPEARAADWAKRLFPAGVHRILAYGYQRFGSLG